MAEVALGDAHRRRHLLLGVASWAARAGAGSPAGSTWSAWSAWSASVDYACASFLSYTIGLFDTSYDAFNLKYIFLIFLGDPRHARAASTCSRPTSCRYWNNTSAYWHMVGAAIIVLVLIFGPDVPPERLVRVHALDQQLRLLRRHQRPQVLPLRGAAGRDPDPVHDHRLRRLRPPLRGDHGRRQGGRPGHVAVGVLLGDRRLDPAAVLPVRGQERQRHLEPPTPTAPARRSASSPQRWAWPGSRRS